VNFSQAKLCVSCGISVLSVFFAQLVKEDAKEQGKDAEEAEAQRSAEKPLCLLWFFCALCVFFPQSVDEDAKG